MVNEHQLLETKIYKSSSFNSHFKDKYKNPFKKALYFILNEGPLMTFRKYKSKIIEKQIENKIEIVLALIQKGDLKYICFTKKMGRTLILPPELTFSFDNSFSLDDAVTPKTILRHLESFLPVPSCPIPSELPNLIKKSNPFLTALSETDQSYFCQQYLHYYNSFEPLNISTRKKAVFLVGFGGYIREYVLPHLRNHIAAAVDYKAELIKKHVKVSFPIVPSILSVKKMISESKNPLIIISTYHSDHAQIAFDLLNCNPSARIFIEKPPAVTLEDANLIIKYRENNSWIDIGFNRRYAPLAQRIKKETNSFSAPITISIIVKELKLPSSHWYFWPNQGTRITGNVCHWIDLLIYFIKSKPFEITLINSGDDVSITILFCDGSYGNIVATDRGSDIQGVEEFIEVRSHKTTLTLHDFKKLVIKEDNRIKTIHKYKRDKGHHMMYKTLKQRWKNALPPIYPEQDIYKIVSLTETISNMVINETRHLKLTN